MATTRTTPNARAKGNGKHFAKNQAAPKVVGKSVTKRSANATPNEARGREILVGTKRSSGDLPRALGSRPVQDWGSRFRTTRSSLRLDQARFGHLLGCSIRSLVNYEKGASPKGAVLVRFIELLNLIEFLRTVIPEEAQVTAWLHSEVPDLNDRTPLEMFAAGDSAKLYALVYGAIAGVAQ